MRKRGFTLVEVIIATLLVGGVCVASVRVVGAARMHQYRNDGAARGAQLAAAMMDEVLAQPYEDPDGDTALVGLEAGEVALLSRALLDDVGDYDGRVDQPPTNIDGDPIPGYGDGWSRTVEVEPVGPALSAVVFVDSGIYRVTVTVHRQGLTVARLVSYRARSADAVAAVGGGVQVKANVTGLDLK
ncbi:MAG: prepilin-type N-terminal cleavage/methylation domain-containing protein [Planctomycetota bacterium]